MAGLAGLAVAITGGARGIGLACARMLAQRGARVSIGDLDGSLAASEAARLAHPGAGLELDVSDNESFRSFLAASEAHFGGPLDVLINNAGIMWVGRFEDEPDAVAHRQMEVNFYGVVRGMRLAIPPMRERGYGHIVNLASAASKLPTAGEATYSATKHAVYGYCVAAREELRGSGVRLSLVMPVVVETELARGTSHGRGPRLRPDQVAQAVVGVIEHPRFEVFVPRRIGALARLMALLPEGSREALYVRLMPNQLRDGESAHRAEYERRAL